MTDSEWLTTQRSEARAECRKCGGKSHDDCDMACRYWALTATEQERARASGGEFQPRTQGAWQWRATNVREDVA